MQIQFYNQGAGYYEDCAGLFDKSPDFFKGTSVNEIAASGIPIEKIVIGGSQSYLLQILREVRLLESLRHPNIITYHHSWLESARFSSFGPAVPTLQYAFFRD